jgi:hypothetical protein
MTITINANHLIWEQEYYQHPTLGPLPRYCHACLDWLNARGYVYRIVAVENGVELDDGYECGGDLAELELDIRIEFENDAEGVEFKLVFADEETV